MLFKNVNIVCLIGEQVINNRSTFQDRAEPCIIVEISKEEDLTSFTDLLKEEFDRLIELNKVKYETLMVSYITDISNQKIDYARLGTILNNIKTKLPIFRQYIENLLVYYKEVGPCTKENLRRLQEFGKQGTLRRKIYLFGDVDNKSRPIYPIQKSMLNIWNTILLLNSQPELNLNGDFFTVASQSTGLNKLLLETLTRKTLIEKGDKHLRDCLIRNPIDADSIKDYLTTTYQTVFQETTAKLNNLSFKFIPGTKQELANQEPLKSVENKFFGQSMAISYQQQTKDYSPETITEMGQTTAIAIFSAVYQRSMGKFSANRNGGIYHLAKVFDDFLTFVEERKKVLSTVGDIEERIKGIYEDRVAFRQDLPKQSFWKSLFNTNQTDLEAYLFDYLRKHIYQQKAEIIKVQIEKKLLDRLSEMIRENSDFLEAYQTDKKNLIAHYDKEISKYYTPARILTIVATHLDGIVEGSMTRFEQEDMSDLLQLYFPDTMSEKLSVDAGKKLEDIFANLIYQWALPTDIGTLMDAVSRIRNDQEMKTFSDELAKELLAKPIVNVRSNGTHFIEGATSYLIGNPNLYIYQTLAKTIKNHYMDENVDDIVVLKIHSLEIDNLQVLFHAK
ncbi:hypothetical protein PFZ59_01425 [Streptococcus suis]|uniref:hypothetical protein n=1 Tax=Streptococcus suis TaxID=1307 RepID=UPI00240E67B0|nr:hypothetical protein [Streptococcus suis]WFA76181.1 hypothetical protein PFZ59_01425 [Streptococcus suis]